MVYNVVEFGAVADGETLCTKAVQKAIENAAQMGAVLYDLKGAGTC